MVAMAGRVVKIVKYALIAVLFSAPAPASAQTLQQEVSALLKDHPRLETARKKLKAAEEGVNVARADYFPKLRVEGDEGYEVTDSPTRRDAGLPTLHTPRTSASVIATQNVFNGFNTVATHEAEKVTRDLAGIAVDFTRAQLLFDAVSAYHNVLRRKMILDLAMANEEVIRQQLALEDARVSLGSGASVDVLFAKSRLQIANERRIAFQGDLHQAIDNFNQVFGHQPMTAEMSVPPTPVDLLPETVDEAVAIALKENASVRDSERSIDLEAQRVRSAASPYFPRIDIVGRADRQNDVDGIEGIRNDASIRLQLSWELFSGLGTRAATAQAKYRQLASTDNRNDVRRQAEENVRIAWDQLATARQRYDALSNAVNIATEVFKARRQLAQSGREVLINVLDAQTEVFNAQIDAKDAEFDTYVLVYHLLQQMGRLNGSVFAAK